MCYTTELLTYQIEIKKTNKVTVKTCLYCSPDKAIWNNEEISNSSKQALTFLHVSVSPLILNTFLTTVSFAC